MSTALSLDLRARLIKAWESGASCREVARVFLVSPSTVIKLVQRYKDTGTIEPKPRGGDHRSKLKEHQGWLLSRVEAVPDISLAELAAELQEQGVTVHISNISRFLKAAGLTYKKNATGQRTRSL